MKERKESIIQLALAISGWATKRGRAYLREDTAEAERADKIIEYWIDHLERKIREEIGTKIDQTECK